MQRGSLTFIMRLCGRVTHQRLKSGWSLCPHVPGVGEAGTHLLCYLLGCACAYWMLGSGAAGGRRETAASLHVGVGPGKSQNNVGKLNLS